MTQSWRETLASDLTTAQANKENAVVENRDPDRSPLLSRIIFVNEMNSGLQ